MERGVVAAVTAYLTPIRRERGKLKRLEQRAATRQLAEELAHRLTDLGEHDELVEACYYELKQQLEAILHTRELRAKQVRTLTNFLESDIKGALERAVGRGIDLYKAEPRQMQMLIEETGIEIQQFLLTAKHEFINRPQGSSSSLVDEKAQEALMNEIGRLEEEYALPAVEGWLRHSLGLIHLTRLTQELSRATQKAIARYEQGVSREASIELLQKEVDQLTQKTVKRIETEALEARVKEALLKQIERLKRHHTADEALTNLSQ